MTTDRPEFNTPEEAAATVRNGRAGYVLTLYTPARRWVAFGDYVATTKEDARVMRSPDDVRGFGSREQRPNGNSTTERFIDA